MAQSNIPRITLLTSGILDAMIAINNGDFPLVRLNGKVPIDSEWQKHGSRLEDSLIHNGNLGFVLGEFESDNGRTRWVVIDIDLEPEVALLLCQTLMKKLGDYCIVIKTASGKYHMLFRVDGYLDMKTHELFGRYQFPYDFKFDEYRQQPIGNKVELFQGLKNPNRQICAVGSEIDGNFYEVAEFSKHNKIYYLPIISAQDLKDKIEFALLEANYETYTPALVSEDVEKDSNVGFVINKTQHRVPSYLIEKEAEDILGILEANDGSKHRIYLALGSYYADSAKIDEDSAIKIHERIVEKRPNLFKNNDDALKTLLKGYSTNHEKNIGAMYIFENHASDLMTAQQYWFKRFRYTNNITRIFPNGQKGTKWDAIVLNPYNKQIEVEKWKVKKGKDGESIDYIDEVKPVLGIEIVDIERIQNSVIPSANDTFRLSYIPSGRNKIQKIEANTLKELYDKLKSQIGVALNSGFSYTFNQLIAFYTRNNLIKVSKIAPVAGIFEIDGVLRRFDYDLNEIEPKYDKQKLINAWSLLEEVRDIINVDVNKFGAIIADGLLLPFYFVLKNHGNMVKYQLMLGAGKTWKSSIAELEINLYNPARINSVSGNIFNAGQFSSEYQVGTKFGISSYPVVINEVAKAFNDENIIEILKSAIETPIARATNDGVYHSYSTLIMTSNADLPQTDAMVRRCNTYYFNKSERLSEDDITALAELLNKNGTNSRFTELSPIGDFVFTFLHENMGLFDTLNTDDLKIRVIEEIEKETGKDLTWCKQDVKEDNNVVIDELDADTLANFTQEIKTIYNYNFRNYHDYEYKDDEGMQYNTLAFSDTNLVALISRGTIPFLAYDSKVDKIFIIGHRVKEFFSKKYNKVVTNKQLIEEFEPFSNTYEVYESQMRIDGKSHRGVRCDVELIIDLLNNDIREPKYDESNGLTVEEEQMLQRLLAKKEAAK